MIRILLFVLSKLFVRKGAMNYGDVLAKLALGEPLTNGEVDFLRLQGNIMQSNAAIMQNWMQPGGNLDPNLFAQYSTGFSILPHECASLIGGSGVTNTIASGSWQDVTLESGNASTWSHGLRTDVDNGRIYVTGIADENIVDIYAWVAFDDSSLGTERGVRIVTDDGSSRHTLLPISGSTNPDQVQVFHRRIIHSTTTYYYMQVYQDTGADLNASFVNLVVCRIR